MTDLRNLDVYLYFMTLAIMQPYLFPYIGYFQLMHAADKMLLLDDVAWINKGWINRNRILVQGQPQYLSFPVAGASQNKTIRELELLTPTTWKNTLEKTLLMAYKKAPQFERFFPVLQTMLHAEITHLSTYIFHSLQVLCQYMQLPVQLIASTGAYPHEALKGQDRILDLCRQEQAVVYINPPGGAGLYDAERFRQQGVQLSFLQPLLTPYAQRGSANFVPALSIIDVLMHCDAAEVQHQLKQYQLV